MTISQFDIHDSPRLRLVSILTGLLWRGLDPSRHSCARGNFVLQYNNCLGQ